MQDYDTEYQEQAGGGAAFAAHADEGTGTMVRIVPLTEGERTLGHRKNGDESPAIWDAEILEAAVDEGRLTDPLRADRPNSLIVKGTGGRNPHHEMAEQVDPDRILGRIDRWEYEPGTGPVGYAELADESVANKIDLGLLDVSGDWLRRLGEYDESRGGKPVTEIVGLPRIHVLERGAAKGASIEIAPETAEALGFNPDMLEADADDGGDGDGDGDDPGDADVDPDEETELHATAGDAVRWDSDAGGAREPSDVRYGVVVNPAPEDAPGEWIVAVYQPDSDYEEWEPRNETNTMADANLDRVGGDGVGSLPPVSQVVEQDAGLINRIASRVAGLINSGSVEQHAVSVHEPTYSDTSEGTAAFADGDWERPTLDDFGADDPEEVADNFLASRSGFPPETYSDLMFPVVFDGTLYRPALGAASSRIPQSDDVSDDEVTELQNLVGRLADDAGWDDFGSDETEQDADTSDPEDVEAEAEASGGDDPGGSGETPDEEVDESGDGEEVDPDDPGGSGDGDGSGDGEQDGDEPAEAVSGTGGAEQQSDSMTDPDKYEELREQLADVKSEKRTLSEEKDALEEQLSEARGEKEDLSDEKEQMAEKVSRLEKEKEQHSEKFDDIRSQLAKAYTEDEEELDEDANLSRVASEIAAEYEQQSERIDELEHEVEPLVGLLARIAAEGSMLDPDKIAETHSARDLVDLIADDDDGEKSYREKVEEQMSQTFSPRGDADKGGSGDEVGELDEEQEAEVEQLAESVMTAKDWKNAQDFSSKREYVRTTKGVDPANAASEQELRQQIKSNAAGDGGEN